ncbi:MAG: hypothetical protein N2035_08410 [Chthoniobacterales bacterium]|nr:hypothetical protein [Chthoniobacterales bacterium]MCX7713664.1 hypothetical protein [Chthoniobacterales bacterium]
MKSSLTLTERELEEWEEAYAAVESYLQALRIRNRLLIAEKVQKILNRAQERVAKEAGLKPRTAAMEETLGEIAMWTQSVLGEPLEKGRMAARGRLALWLADMSGKWQGVFLMPEPWPGEFIKAMRSSYFVAGPGLAELKMVPHPLELSMLGEGAALWYEAMDRRPIVRKIFAALLISLLFSALWFLLF